jgi:hypothetical protein
MPMTYASNAKNKLFQPFFNRFRQIYRGYRSSIAENRELNFFLIDVNKINNSLSDIEKTIDNIEGNFIGNLNNLSDFDISNDGLSYDLTPIKVYYKDMSGLNTASEKNLVLSKANRLSAVLSRVEKKVIRLENGR